MKITDGSSSALIVGILMFVVVAVSAIGFIMYVTTADKQTGIVANDSLNLSGITTSGEIFNGTQSTVHQLSGIFPNFIWLIIAFLIIMVLFIVGMSLKH